MYAGLDLNEVAKDFPEVFRYTRVGPNVPKLPAISQELADQTSLTLGLRDGVVKYDIVGQANHGVCAVGRNPRQAFEHIERLEHICQIVLAAGV
jgi:L-fuculose-phosphate aldolase